MKMTPKSTPLTFVCLQVGFFSGICLPCYELLAKGRVQKYFLIFNFQIDLHKLLIFLHHPLISKGNNFEPFIKLVPELTPMLENCADNLASWKQLSEQKKIEK